MRLSEFIVSNLEEILAEWESFASSIIPEKNLNKLTLRNDAEHILRAIAMDMESSQTAVEQAEKSKGRAPRSEPKEDNAAQRHSEGRVRVGFNQVQMVSEYRALRASVIRLWMASSPELNASAVDELIRFNESIDQAVAGSVARFMEQIEKSRDFAIAVLAHDLRNPLNAITASGQCLGLEEQPDQATIKTLGTIIRESGTQMSKLIDTLLDFTRTRLGRPLLIKREPIELRTIFQQTVDAFAAAHPSRSIQLECGGTLRCNVDAMRIRQMLSNLIANAIQHGSETSPITITTCVESHEVVLRVHNQGPAIAPSAIPTLFDFSSKDIKEDTGGMKEVSHLGLGLYITRQIVEAHSGTIRVTSTAQSGTTFEVRLPCAATEEQTV